MFPEGLQLQVEIAAEIFKEREDQDEKWGTQDHGDPNWSMILGEEVGEVCKAALELEFKDKYNYPHASQDKVREELIQVAAVAMAWIEAIDRRNK